MEAEVKTLPSLSADEHFIWSCDISTVVKPLELGMVTV